MFRRILVALENKPGDDATLEHVRQLARSHAAQLRLLHVADGWAARNFSSLKLSESEEMREDWSYLERTGQHLRADGFEVEISLELGDPADGILKAAREQGCDLIVVRTHGHRIVGDLIHGETIEKVRHRASVPLYVVPAPESTRV